MKYVCRIFFKAPIINMTAGGSIRIVENVFAKLHCRHGGVGVKRDLRFRRVVEVGGLPHHTICRKHSCAIWSLVHNGLLGHTI